MNIKLLFKNISYTMTSNLMTLVISTVLVLVVPKFIGIEEYGYWQLYVFYSNYVGVLTFGWADGVYLRYGGRDYEDLNKDLFHSQFIMLLIAQIIIFLIIIQSAFFISNANKAFVFKSIAIYLILFNMKTFVQYILQDTSRIREYSIVNSIGKVFYFLFVIIALFFKVTDFRILIAADLVGSSISLVISMLYVRDIIFRRFSKFYWSFKETWANLSSGINLMIANLAGMLVVGIVRYGIEWRWGVKVFGKVSLVLSISNFLITFVSAVSLVLYPTLRKIGIKKAKEIFKSISSVLMLLLLGALFIFYPLDYLLPKWLPKYNSSLSYLAVLFPIFIYQGKFDLLINTYMKTLRFEKVLLRINIATVTFSIFVTIIDTLVIQNVAIAMFSIIVILFFQCFLGEIYIAKKMKVKVAKSLFQETLIILIFIGSGVFFSNLISFFLFLVTMILYALSNKIDIFTAIKLISSNSEENT